MSDSPSSVIKPTKSNSRKSHLDFSILSPLLKEPFKKGWKREVVYRAIVGNERRNMCDIYYFAPDGKKLRSRREVSDYLNKTKSSFTTENFTFCKEPIGMDVKYEVLRFARSKTCQDGEANKKALLSNNGIIRTGPKRVLQRSYQIDDDEEALTGKETTSKSSAPAIDDDKTTSKRHYTRLRNIPKTLHSSDITLTLHNSNSKSDSGYTSGQSNVEERLKSPTALPKQIYKTKTESPARQSLVPILESPEMLREPQSHNLPLIALLPCGTTLVISDSQTLTISSTSINSSTTPVRRSETLLPKISLPAVTGLSESVGLSSVASLSPYAATSLNTTTFENRAKSIPGNTPIRRSLLPKTDGFAIPRFPLAYEGQVSLAPFGTVYRERSYWISMGQALIEEGLQRAMLSHPYRTSGTIEEHPVRATRKKSVPKRFQDVIRSSSPTPVVRMACKDYFAFRKQRRQQQLFDQPPAMGSSTTNN